MSQHKPDRKPDSESEKDITSSEYKPYDARRTSDMPKQEQTPAYDDDDIPSYSYRAQDTASSGHIYHADNREYPASREGNASYSGGRATSSGQQQQQQMRATEQESQKQESQERERSAYQREWSRQQWDRGVSWRQRSQGMPPALRIALIVVFVFVVLPMLLRIVFALLGALLALFAGLLFIAMGVGAMLLFARLISRR